MAGKLRGLSTVLNNLKKSSTKMKSQSTAGLIKAAIMIRRDMDHTPPLIPVDTNFMRSSWFAEPVIYKGMRLVRIGFSANYAVYVHEMVGATFKRHGAGAKFFEASLNRNRGKILKTLGVEIRRIR